MWTWHQKRAELFNAAGELVATGYSGHGDGVNNPALEGVRNVGPLPRGRWMIGPPRDVPIGGAHGPYVLPLTAKAGTETYGRDGFLIHGDAVEHAGAQAASEGCLILARPIRERLWSSGDHELEVV